MVAQQKLDLSPMLPSGSWYSTCFQTGQAPNNYQTAPPKYRRLRRLLESML